MKEFVFAVAMSYLLIPVIGAAAKLWYRLFMFGWGLL